MPDKPQIAVGLDAGSAFTRCVILAMEEGRLRYLGHGQVPSSGWHKSRLTDQPALTRSVREAVHQAEAEARVVVDAMVVGVGGVTIDGHNSRGIYEFGRPRPVSIEDMAYAVERSEQVRLEDDRAILHLFPQDFTLDGRSGKRYPRGSVCSRLEANVHLVTVSEQEHDSICGAVHQASYAVEETVFEPVAAAYAAISKDDRVRGVAVVDIGMHSTGLVVYDGEAVLLARSLPISADHLTRDVAVGLTVQYADAERLKMEYGCAMLGLTSDHSFIEVPSLEGRPPREAPRKQLNEILGGARRRAVHPYWLGTGHHRHGAEAARRNHIVRRRRVAQRHVRHGRAGVELSGAQRAARRHGEFSGRAVHSSLDRRSRLGQIFGALEIQARS